jgi:hypothetical protein
MHFAHPARPRRPADFIRSQTGARRERHGAGSITARRPGLGAQGFHLRALRYGGPAVSSTVAVAKVEALAKAGGIRDSNSDSDSEIQDS